MIDPGELHRYFIVREIATGRELWLLNGDAMVEVTGDGWRDYRCSPNGEYFLVRPAVEGLPAGRPMRLDEVEPLPDGRGLWSPDAWEHTSKLAVTYPGSWREYAANQIHT